jgi:LuxR family maltose regulon positive regulatory protein
MVSTASLARLAFEHGQLHLAFEIAAPACTRLAEGGALPPISTVVYGMLGEVYYQWHQLEEAAQQMQRALHLSRLGGYPSGVIGCRLLLSRVALAAGEVEAAAQEIQAAADLLQGDTPDYVRHEAVAQQVRVYLARNRPAAAEMALQGEGFSFEAGFSYPDLPPGGRVSHAMGLVYNSSLGAVLHRARTGGDGAGLAAGIALAGRVIEGALAGRALLVAVEALLLRARMRAALEQTEAAGEADILRALGLAEPEGCIAVFVEQGAPVAEALARLLAARRLGRVARDYVAGILDAFGRGRSGAAGGGGAGGLVEPLTAREVEVLGLMAAGLTYKEIGGRLVISLNTVRSHVKAIYGKLGVDKRVKAVERARELGIL